MLSAPACLCSVQIITAHTVIHNHHLNSLVSLRNKPQTHTLCPSACCFNECDHTIRSTNTDGATTILRGGRWVNCVISHCECAKVSRVQTKWLLFSLLSSPHFSSTSLWHFFLEKPIGKKLFNFKVIYSLCNTEEMLTFIFPLFQGKNHVI